MPASVLRETVLPDGARAELALVLADPRFKVSHRNRAFLKYVGEAALRGQCQGIKAYTIAVDVFGRGADFNGDIDPIVRIEATRLRQSLEQYYLSFGLDHDVHMRLPRGRYIAEFYAAPIQQADAHYKLVAIRQHPRLLEELPHVAVQTPPTSGWLSRYIDMMRTATAWALR
jgi:hypothetical protein